MLKSWRAKSLSGVTPPREEGRLGNGNHWPWVFKRSDRATIRSPEANRHRNFSGVICARSLTRISSVLHESRMKKNPKQKCQFRGCRRIATIRLPTLSAYGSRMDYVAVCQSHIKEAQ